MKPSETTLRETNQLFPVFLKLEKFKVLIVGGGNVALEKLNAIVGNTSGVSIKLVAGKFHPEVLAFAAKHNNHITLVEKRYVADDLNEMQIVIVAVNDPQISRQIYEDAHQRGLLVNAADKPEWCDFYLGSIVQKGNLKIAISTNGKSPSIAKKLREVFTELLPAELDEVLVNMNSIRNSLKGDFATKVSKLKAITQMLNAGNELN